MKYVKIQRSFTETPLWKGARGLARGGWISLIDYCTREENSGQIESCRTWDDHEWLVTLGMTREDLDAVISRGLAQWLGNSLRVVGYDLIGENEYIAARMRGQMGGRPTGSSTNKTKSKPYGKAQVSQVVRHLVKQVVPDVVNQVDNQVVNQVDIVITGCDDTDENQVVNQVDIHMDNQVVNQVDNQVVNQVPNLSSINHKPLGSSLVSTNPTSLPVRESSGADQNNDKQLRPSSIDGFEKPRLLLAEYLTSTHPVQVREWWTFLEETTGRSDLVLAREFLDFLKDRDAIAQFPRKVPKDAIEAWKDQQALIRDARKMAQERKTQELTWGENLKIRAAAAVEERRLVAFKRVDEIATRTFSQREG